MPAAFNRRGGQTLSLPSTDGSSLSRQGSSGSAPFVPLTNTALAAFYIVLGGGGWIRTTEARASDLQSDPFGHSGTPPEGRTFSRCRPPVSTASVREFCDSLQGSARQPAGIYHLIPTLHLSDLRRAQSATRPLVQKNPENRARDPRRDPLERFFTGRARERQEVNE